MTHSQNHRTHRPHNHADDERMATLLDLDASAQAVHLAELTDWVAGLAGNPETIVDLGAGTGTGTLALAKRFQEATVYAVDNSELMLERLGRKIDEHGLDGRVHRFHADLDTQWPPLGQLDLAWAASSIHHVADPNKVFGEVFAALNPGGLFAVVEMDAFPRFLPEDIGFGMPGLEERCHQANDSEGRNSHPDWRGQLEQAGFDVERRVFSYALTPDSTVMEPYARVVLGNFRATLGDRLSPVDLESIDALLDPASPASLAHRTDLLLRGSRTVWAARRN